MRLSDFGEKQVIDRKIYFIDVFPSISQFFYSYWREISGRYDFVFAKTARRNDFSRRFKTMRVALVTFAFIVVTLIALLGSSESVAGSGRPEFCDDYRLGLSARPSPPQRGPIRPPILPPIRPK